MILKNVHERLAFRFGRHAALRSTTETVDRLVMQIEQLQQQLKFNSAEYERQIAVLRRLDASAP